MMLRSATAADAAAVAEIYLAARQAELPFVRWAHRPDEVRRWVAESLVPGGGVTLGERDGAPCGYIARHREWVDHLYVAPAHLRQGIGRSLLDHAKDVHPAGLRLWCFQRNRRARAFYEGQGFAIDRLSDGADNEEHEPDVLYVWPGRSGQ
jgi:GNAT superfamily N-acetyltransferase